jgi:hypothetical protein
MTGTPVREQAKEKGMGMKSRRSEKVSRDLNHEPNAGNVADRGEGALSASLSIGARP